MAKQTTDGIGILTSGGDAPGMNACIRAAVRTCVYFNVPAFGIYNGFQGLIDNQIQRFQYNDVSNIIQRGGTVLGSARSEEFFRPEGRKKAAENLKKYGIDKLVIIGGDGSFQGAAIFQKEHGIKIIGCPGTIDNDLSNTDYTIGFDTAVNTVVDAVDKIRDTASAHHRLFFIEVMGRDAGFIALRSGLSVGAEEILIPEVNTSIDALVKKLSQAQSKAKSSIVIVSEGEEEGGAFKIAEKVKYRLPEYDARVSILGHLQRGGKPSAFDRLLATRMGYEAVTLLIDNQSNKVTCWENNGITLKSIDQVIKGSTEPELSLLELVKILSTY